MKPLLHLSNSSNYSSYNEHFPVIVLLCLCDKKFVLFTVTPILFKILIADTEEGLGVIVYECNSKNLETCIELNEYPLTDFIPGFVGDDIDLAFYKSEVNRVFLYSNETLRGYRQNPRVEFIEEVVLNNMVHMFNNTDAAFHFQQDGEDRIMLLQGHDMYVTDLYDMMTYVGQLKSPCLEEED